MVLLRVHRLQATPLHQQHHACRRFYFHRNPLLKPLPSLMPQFLPIRWRDCGMVLGHRWRILRRRDRLGRVGQSNDQCRTYGHGCRWWLPCIKPNDYCFVWTCGLRLDASISNGDVNLNWEWAGDATTFTIWRTHEPIVHSSGLLEIESVGRQIPHRGLNHCTLSEPITMQTADVGEVHNPRISSNTVTVALEVSQMPIVEPEGEFIGTTMTSLLAFLLIFGAIATALRPLFRGVRKCDALYSLAACFCLFCVPPLSANPGGNGDANRDTSGGGSAMVTPLSEPSSAVLPFSRRDSAHVGGPI